MGLQKPYFSCAAIARTVWNHGLKHLDTPTTKAILQGLVTSVIFRGRGFVISREPVSKGPPRSAMLVPSLVEGHSEEESDEV